MNLKASRAAALIAALSCSTFLSPTPLLAQVPPSQNEGQKAARGKADRSTYYRVQASYLYLGERVDFDIQVGCNVYVSVGLDRDRSMMTGLAPMAYGLPMKDGGGLVIVPPKACGGETSENGKIPPNYIPYPITFEDYTKPFEGLGYQSTEAFDSPISKLKFIEAKVTTSTKEAFEAWRVTEASKNIIKPHMLTFKLGDPFNTKGDYNWRPGGYFPDTCFRVNRAEIPKEARPYVTSDWPSSKPKYWSSHETKLKALEAPTRDRVNSNNWLISLTHGRFNNITNLGSLKKINSDFVFILDSKYKHAGTFYPYKVTFNLSDITYINDPKFLMTYKDNGESIYTDAIVKIYEKYKGFSLCNAMGSGVRNVPQFEWDMIESKVNNQTVGSVSESGLLFRHKGKIWLAGMTDFVFFENDTHLLIGRRDQFIGFGGSL